MIVGHYAFSDPDVAGRRSDRRDQHVHVPIVLGNGKKLFGEGARPAAFTLVDNKVTTKGVLIARYQRAGNVVTGDFALDPPTPAEVARRDRMNREG